VQAKHVTSISGHLKSQCPLVSVKQWQRLMTADVWPSLTLTAIVNFVNQTVSYTNTLWRRNNGL